MSKTATVANTKTTRGAQQNAVGPSHHVITRGKDETKSHLKDPKQKQAQGHALNGSSRERSERRISIRNNATENNRLKSRNDRNEVTEKRNMSSAVENETPAAESTNTKKPIEEYYKEKGLDYRLLRKTCRIRVNEGSGAKGEAPVYFDSYQLPAGYSPEDLPDSQGALSQNNEDPLSPAVMIAADQKKGRTKVLTLTPDNTDTSEEIIRRIQMGRRCKKNESAELQQPTDCNNGFPDKSLNESDLDLIMASQQVESQLEVNSNCEKLPSKDVCKRDINGNNKKHASPLTSTPLPELVKNVIPVKETPKTARPVSRSRNRSNNQINTNPEKSMFENSAETECLNVSVEGEGGATPRKILKFDESPIKNVMLEIRCDANEGQLVGEEFDDNEDELFSQVEMPGEIRIPKPSVSGSSLESANSAQITLLDEGSNGQADTNGEMDSYLDADALDAIAKLEAIHCTSSGSTGSSAQNKSNDKKAVSSEYSSKFTQKKETPRTPARRMGLSRRVVVR